MSLVNIINIAIALLSMVSILKPMLILYVIPTIFIYVNLPGMTSDINSLKLIEFGSINIYATDLIIGATICYILFCFIFKTDKFKEAITTPISIAILVVLIWDIIIGYIYYHYNIPIKNILRIFSGKLLMLLPILIPLINRFDERKEKLIRYIFIVSMVMVFVGIWRFLLGEIQITSSGTPRSLRGFDVFIFLFGTLYIVFYKKEILNSKNIAYLALFLLFIGIHLAGHRSGYIVFFLGLAASDMILKSPLAKLSVFFIVVSAFFAISSGFLLSSTKAGDSLMGDFLVRFKDTYNVENTTTQDRLDMWTDAIEISKKSPLFGKITVYKYRAQMNESEDHFVEAPHNVFIDKIINEGYLGLIVLIGLIITIVWQANQIRDQDNDYIMFLMAFFILCIVFSFFNQTYVRRIPRGILFLGIGLINVEYVQFRRKITKNRNKGHYHSYSFAGN